MTKFQSNLNIFIRVPVPLYQLYSLQDTNHFQTMCVCAYVCVYVCVWVCVCASVCVEAQSVLIGKKNTEDFWCFITGKEKNKKSHPPQTPRLLSSALHHNYHLPSHVPRGP